MNSFRVVDTKFRILKGGKIGLSLSIALIGSLLNFNSTNAYATDYFTDVDTTLGTNSNTSGTFDLTVQTATNTGVLSNTRTETTFDDIIFKPTSWATTSYSSSTFNGDVDNSIPLDSVIDYSQYTINSVSASLPELTLTIDTSSNALNISKNSLLKYDTTASGTVNISSNTTYNLNSVSSSLYTANLIFNGSNTVSGNTDIDNGNIKLNGTATFVGTVEAGSIDVDTTNTITFNSAVDLSAGTTDTMRISTNGNIILNSDLTGNITTTANNQGIVTSTGSSQTITGNIGTSTSLDLNTLNIGSATDSTNYSSTIINGDVYASSTVLNNNGITNSSSLILSNGSDITSSITTADSNMGILTLLGSSTITGSVGTSTDKLSEVNSGANGSNSTITDNVYAVNVTNTGTGTTTFKNNVVATNVNVNAGTTNIENNLTATNTNISTGTANLNTLSGNTSSNIVFTGAGVSNLYGNLTGNITTSTNNQGIVTVVGDSSGKVQTITGNIGTSSLFDLNVLNIGETGSSSNYTTSIINGNVYANNTVLNNGTTNSSELKLSSDKNITSTITTADNDKGILTLLGGTQTVAGSVGTSGAKLAEVNAGDNAATSTFSSDVFATNLDVEGTGTVNLNGNFAGTTVRYNADGSVNLADNKNIDSSITTASNNTGTLNLLGTSTVSGTVGTSANKLKEINSGITAEVGTFSSDVFATNLDVEGTGTVNLNGNFTGTTLRYNADGSVNLVDNKNIDSSITTALNNTGTLNLLGTSTVSGTVGTSVNKLKEINSGITAEVGTFNSDVYATNLDVEGTGTVNLNGNFTGTAVRYNADGNINIADNKNIDSSITTALNNTGTLNLLGTSTVSGTVGTSGAKLAEVNLGINGSTSTFNSDVYATDITNTGTGTTTFKDNVVATNVNVNAGITNIEDNLTATSTTISTGTANLNTVSGTTSSDIVFSGVGAANLNGNLTGDIKFAGNNASVNVSDGKGILGSIETLASNNTGILNYKGDGSISGTIGSSIYGIKELNVNTNNEQDKDSNGVVLTQGLFISREIYADVIGLKNNATLTLANNANITNTGSDNLVIATDASNSGKLVFEGSSEVTGEVGTSTNNLSNITAGVTNETVVFNDMVHALNLFYTGNGTVELKGDNSSNGNIEGIIGTVDLNANNASLKIGDDVNITTGTSGTQFANANSATLTFDGNSTVTGVLGGNTTGNSTFEKINAGADGKIVTFKNDVYVKESSDTTFHVSGTGTVNFEGNLNGDLVFDNDGTVNIANSKSVIVSTVPLAIRTENDDFGTLNFEGNTTLYTDIGSSSNKLKNVTFASIGTSSNTYNQNINKNIYAQNTYIGNGSNKTNANITEDITFGGNLDLRSNSSINVNDFDVNVVDDLTIANNATLSFKVYTTDISAGAAVENPRSGSITANTLTMANDTKININYDGSWYGAGKYNLINATSATTDYYGTELNALVSDNSIIDSVIKKDGNNLTLFADRTGEGSYDPKDLYIVKSEIGKDYSNTASNSLANYANKAQRAGALSEIIRRMEELEGGLVLSESKKDEMINTQRLLTPIANSSNIQSSITSSNLALKTIGGRLSDVRAVQSNSVSLNKNEKGLSSGDDTLDSTLWLKAIGSKTNQANVENYTGFDTSTYGFVGGIDKILKNDALVGLAFAYSNTKTDQNNAASDSSDTKSLQATLYGSKEIGNTYIDAFLSYSKHSTDGIRTANSGELSYDVDAEQISAKIESGYKFKIDKNTSLTPFGSLEYSFINQKAYTEKGSSYQNDALVVDSLNLNRGTVEVGAKLKTDIQLENALISPQLSASVYSSFGDNKSDIKAQFIGGGDKFVTPVQELNKTMYNVGFGLETKLSENTSLNLDIDYDRSTNGDFEGYSGSLTFGVKF
jgi:hypothetical protein